MERKLLDADKITEIQKGTAVRPVKNSLSKDLSK